MTTREPLFFFLHALLFSTVLRPPPQTTTPVDASPRTRGWSADQRPTGYVLLSSLSISLSSPLHCFLSSLLSCQVFRGWWQAPNAIRRCSLAIRLRSLPVIQQQLAGYQMGEGGQGSGTSWAFKDTWEHQWGLPGHRRWARVRWRRARSGLGGRREGGASTSVVFPKFLNILIKAGPTGS